MARTTPKPERAIMGALRSVGLKLAVCIAIPSVAAAQIGLPALPQVDIGPALGSVTDLARLHRLPVAKLARDLADARIDRLTRFAARNRDTVELDDDRNPAVRDVLITTRVDAAAVARAEAKGFHLIDRQEIDGLEISFVRFAVPEGQRLGAALKAFKALAGNADVSVDHLYFASGRTAPAPSAAGLAPSAPVTTPAIGLIDGGVAAHPSLSGLMEQRGFAPGAPLASAHGTAVASLIAGRGSIRGSAPGAALLAADVYGNTAVGGSATAIARALGWMAQRQVPVVTISLVGPDNSLLRAAVRAAQGKGMLVVAAVGNDGPAAPPSYPASLPGVLAITGVDARERALPEAGRALHVDFAAPGADMKGAAPDGGITQLRGTSFAAPLAAGRLAALYPRPNIGAIEAAVRILIADAKDLGKKGRDPVYGHGLVCGDCVTR
jgi:minor extracellular protease Epr